MFRIRLIVCLNIKNSNAARWIVEAEICMEVKVCIDLGSTFIILLSLVIYLAVMKASF